MLKSYFLIALRSFKKDRTNACISLSGLIVGLTCVFLIIGYIRYETSYDSSYDNAPRIYAVLNHLKDETQVYTSANIPSPLSPTLKREIPEIQYQTSMNYGQVSFIKNKGEIQKVDNVSVDDDFFKMFNFHFVYGNARSAFQNPNSMVLTKTGAKNLFGKIPALGSILYNNDSVALTLTGVIEDLPSNTFFRSDVFINHPVVKDPLNYMAYSGASNCIMIGKENTIDQVKSRLTSLYNKYDFDNSTVEFIPVKDIHLNSANIRDFPENYNIGNIKYVYVYGCIAFLILLIGCFNFINLSMARSLERAKEIGVRKLFGAQQKQLIFQYICESALYFVMALPPALLLAIGCWGPFNHLLNIEAPLWFLINLRTALVFCCVCVVSSFLCSAYPAFILSRLNPVNILKGSWIGGIKLNLGLRKVLIVIQFAISIVLIISTLVVHAQLKFLNKQNLGFNKSNLIMLNFNDFGQKESAFKNDLLLNSGVISASLSRMKVAKTYGSLTTLPSPKDSAEGLRIADINGDVDFMNTLKVPVIQGKEFAKKMLHSTYGNETDSLEKKNLHPTYVTKALLDIYDIKGDPIGKSIKKIGIYIIGVIGDLKAISLKEENPLITISIATKPIRYGYMYIRIAGSNTAGTINYIASKWKQFFPKSAFDYSFVDDRIAHLYDSENRLTSLFDLFALLAIIISCSGLFSLVSLMVRKKAKEISVRKVLGASTSDIVFLISKEFLWLIMIAFVLSMPFAYYVLNKWLEGYATKTRLYWWLFVFSGAVAICIAILSICFKSIAAARTNPVHSLRES